MAVDKTFLDGLPVIHNRVLHSRAYRAHSANVATIIADVMTAMIGEGSAADTPEMTRCQALLTLALRTYARTMGLD